MSALSLLIVCPGVGHVVRGFESFAEESFEALRGRPELRVTLVGGRRRAGADRLTAPVPAADAAVARALGTLMRRDGYFAQQLLFALELAPLLAARRPDVVLLSDWVLASALGRVRAATRQRFKLLLSNGAPGGPRFDRTIDHVQQLTPAMYRVALDGGEPPERHTLLSLGRAIPSQPPPDAPDREARRSLGLPSDAELLLCVSALNVWHKRLDYLIDEVAALETRPHLVLLGQPERETPLVLRRARDRLGVDGFTVRAVPRSEVDAYYRAADVLVHPAVHEALGLVLVEGLAHGLPVVSHDSTTTRFVLGPHGFLGDLSRPGGLAAPLAAARAAPASERATRHRSAYERFSWERLAPRYVEMIRACAAS